MSFPPNPPMPPQGTQGAQPPAGYNPYGQPPIPPQQQGGYDPSAGLQQQYVPPMYPPQQPYQPMGGQPQGGAQQASHPPMGYNPYGQPPMPPQEIVTQPIGSFGRDAGFFTKVKVPANSLQFDDQEFLRLLAGSISLTKDEKKKIIEAVPTLTQFQITELIRILNEEKQKFSELDVKHKEQLDMLQEQHKREWEELEEEMTAGDVQSQELAQLEQARMVAQQLQQNQGGQMPPKV